MNAWLPLTLLAETTRSELRWHALPPAWVVALIVIPLVVAIGWWGYRRERDLTPGRRLLLAGLRSSALLLFLLVFFGPYMELSEIQTVRAHLVVLLDSSARQEWTARYIRQMSRMPLKRTE